MLARDDRRARNGRKELIALAEGYRESAESWADLLRDCARRGMRAPVLAVGDGALGFWNALRVVFPQAPEGRCWFHKTANVLAALPKSADPAAKKAMAEIWGAEDKDHALAAVNVNLRTTNPIESTFAAVCHRTKVTKRPGSQAAGLAMAFKLIEAAQDRWSTRPTLSPWSAPERPSSTANSSKDPARIPSRKQPKRS